MSETGGDRLDPPTLGTGSLAPGRTPQGRDLLGALPLNREQRDAARHFEGPALVLAGPGTGKTTTLVGRYCFLLDQGVAPESVFVSTFTRKAADQLKERISAASGIATSRLPIGTFHSLCLRILRESGARMGVAPNFQVIRDSQQYRLLRDLKLDWRGELEDLRDAIARLKDRLVTPEEALRAAVSSRSAGAEEALAVARAYVRYQGALQKQGLLDFGDLVGVALQGLQQCADLRRAYSERFQFVLVDEFQDVNAAPPSTSSAKARAPTGWLTLGSSTRGLPIDWNPNRLPAHLPQTSRRGVNQTVRDLSGPGRVSGSANVPLGPERPLAAVALA